MRINAGTQVLAAERHASHLDDLISAANVLVTTTKRVVIFHCDDKSEPLLHEASAFYLIREDILEKMLKKFWILKN